MQAAPSPVSGDNDARSTYGLLGYVLDDDVLDREDRLQVRFS